MKPQLMFLTPDKSMADAIFHALAMPMSQKAAILLKCINKPLWRQMEPWEVHLEGLQGFH